MENFREDIQKIDFSSEEALHEEATLEVENDEDPFDNEKRPNEKMIIASTEKHLERIIG